jgi:FkbM family methyltransferase
MIWLSISKIFARLYGLFHDKFKYNIRGFGFVMRRTNSDAILNLHGHKIFFDHSEAEAYSRVLGGAWNEPETHIFIRRIAANLKFCFIEVGGSIGEILVDIAKCQNVTSTYVFEPNPRCAKIIKLNLILNDLEHVELEQAAVGEHSGTSKMYFGSHSPTASILSESSKQFGQDVAVVTLDKYFQGKQLETNLVMLIDVEGYEPFVLRGAKKIIENYQPTIIFEYNDYSRMHYHITEIYKILGDSYKIFRLRNDGLLDEEIDFSFNCVAINIKNINFYKNEGFFFQSTA